MQTKKNPWFHGFFSFFGGNNHRLARSSTGGVPVELIPEHSTSKSELLLLYVGGHDGP